MRSARGIGIVPTVIALLGLAWLGCAGGESADTERSTPEAAETAATLPPVVRISDPGLHPEGIEYDAADERFLVSSVTRGTVTAVADDGTHSVFIEDPDIVSSIGIHIDRATSRLLVANSNVAAFQGGDSHGMLGAYDLDTGDRIFMADLGALIPDSEHFANDVTVGPDGTAYVTDSMTPAIYAVTTGGEPSVLLQGGVLAEGGFLNGIDYHPDGYLIVAQAGANRLLRVELSDDMAVTPVSVPEPFGADGLTLMPDGRLVAVATTGEGEAAISEVLLLESADGWASAEIVGRQEAAESATTAAVRQGAVYAIDARFEDMGGEEPAPFFEIERFVFE